MTRSKLLLCFAVPLACLSARSRQGTSPQPSLEVAANTFAHVSDLGQGPQVVAVMLHNFPPLGAGDVTLSVSALGAAVTPGVAINHTIAFAFPDPSHPNLVEYRLDIFEVGLGSPILLALSAGNVISYTASVGGLAQPVSASGSTLLLGGAGAAAAQDPCVQNCVCAFVAALGASKSHGKTSLAVATASDPSAAVSAAEQTLRNCLQECVPPVDKVNDTFFCPNPGSDGGTLKVIINMRANGGGADSTVTGSADLVIAIAGNADATGTGKGGNATATNNQSGGASLATAGDGGNNANSPGAGGKATANSAGANNSGGDSVAIGGNGGGGSTSGGVGGDASATTSGIDANATAQGGNGGDPVNDLATGGNGGNADARRGIGGTNRHTGGGQPGNPNPPQPGHHGQGGASSIGPGPGSGPNYDGIQLLNVP